MGARRFLLGDSADAVTPAFLHQTRGLYHAFEQWCQHWEMDCSLARMLYDRTIKNIQPGRIISTVLADVADESVWHSRYSSYQNGGFSYIVFNRNGI